MKKNLIYISTIVIIVLLNLTGCKYDVTEPLWDKPYTPPASATISQITPGQAAEAGVNMITITGTNFADSSADIMVQFDNVIAEIVNNTPTSITVRRPNISGDNLTVKVVSNNSYLVAKHSPYKVARVSENYGSFLDNVSLGAIAADGDGNLYVSGGASPHTIYKVNSNGQKAVLIDTIRGGTGMPTGVITDMKVGPGGYLYLFRGNRIIQRVNPSTGEVRLWHNLKSNLKLSCGDFDANGTLFAGGANKVGLFRINQDSTSDNLGLYSQDSIFALKVAKGFVYVAVSSAGKRAVYKHAITGSGLGNAELVFDFANTPYANRKIKSLSVGDDGTVYIGTAYTEPLLVVNNGVADILYKGIIPPYIAQASFGTGDNLYIVSGSATPAQTFTVFRLHVGVNCAAK